MYRVLIADDEPFILDGLKYVINWEEHGLEITSTVKNGIEALEVLENIRIDILITDIRMPKMDGLDLIREIRQRAINTKVVIMSGYTEFEYAREAARLGIENYILKPVQEEELSSTLLAAVEKIEAEQYLKVEQNMGLEIIRENILYRWVTGMIGDAELRQRSDLIGISLDSDLYMACVMEIQHTREDTEHRQANPDTGHDRLTGDIGLMQFAVCNICLETFQMNNNINNTAFRNLDGNVVIILCWNETDGFNYDKALELVNACIGNIRTSLNSDICALAGSVEHGYLSAAKSYKNALSLRNTLPVFPFCGVVDWNSAPLIADAAEKSPRQSVSFSPLVTKAVKYIHDRYHEEISLKTLSAVFDVNPAYLGQQFKKETGQMFTNYLNYLRIEKAKELLLNPNLKANEIAVKVGYANQNYFYNIFRKYTGIYPSEYKKIRT